MYGRILMKTPRAEMVTPASSGKELALSYGARIAWVIFRHMREFRRAATTSILERPDLPEA